MFFYILDIGNVGYFINGFQVKTLKRGACIGETALLYKKPREATIKSLQDTKLWFINNIIFQQVLSNVNRATTSTARAHLLKVPFYNLLTNEQQDSLAEGAYLMKYPKDFKFLAQSMSKSSLYVIQSGKIELRRMGKPVYTLKKGEFFGENNIYGRDKKIPVAFTAEETVVI